MYDTTSKAPFYERIAHRGRTLIVYIRHAYWSLYLARLGKGTKFYGPVWMSRPDLVSIGKDCTLNRGLILNTKAPISIGNGVRIAARVIINSASLDSTPSERRVHTAAPVTIMDGAWIGAGAIINPGVTIGEGAIVGAGSVVLQDVPPRTLVFGVPARVIREMAETPIV